MGSERRLGVPQAATSTMNVGRSSPSRSSTMDMLRKTCRLTGRGRLSGLARVDIDISADDVRLPGVLVETVGLMVRTLALGILTVVTDSEPLSRILAGLIG